MSSFLSKDTTNNAQPWPRRDNAATTGKILTIIPISNLYLRMARVATMRPCFPDEEEMQGKGEREKTHTLLMQVLFTHSEYSDRRPAVTARHGLSRNREMRGRQHSNTHTRIDFLWL